jgi:hypothetical protein
MADFIEPNSHLEEIVEDLDELNEVLPANFSITSYGADYPVDGLVKRIAQGDILVPLFSLEPEVGQTTVGFQREFVWRKPQADRFIESLLLGLPVPGIFLVKEPNGKHLVLDGQQRLRTLENFYSGLFQGKEFSLENVQDQWRQKTYKTIHPDDRRRLDDSIIHATIVRQDEPTEDQSSIYLIFERLNSGGTFLQPQEIRVALYHGPFAALLSKMSDNSHWRALRQEESPVKGPRTYSAVLCAAFLCSELSQADEGLLKPLHGSQPEPSETARGAASRDFRSDCINNSSSDWCRSVSTQGRSKRRRLRFNPGRRGGSANIRPDHF